MVFYFIRHGQTEHNARHLLAGSGLDVALNAQGHQQAARLARGLLKTLEHPVARVVVSPMIRTRETAHYLTQALGLEPQFEPDLKEWHMGEWEGQTFDQFGAALLEGGEPQSGERRLAFYDRVEQGWRRHHRPDEAYLIVSHGAVWLALQDRLQIPRFKLNNCDLVQVRHQAGTWSARILDLRD